MYTNVASGSCYPGTSIVQTLRQSVAVRLRVDTECPNRINLSFRNSIPFHRCYYYNMRPDRCRMQTLNNLDSVYLTSLRRQFITAALILYYKSRPFVFPIVRVAYRNNNIMCHTLLYIQCHVYDVPFYMLEHLSSCLCRSTEEWRLLLRNKWYFPRYTGLWETEYLNCWVSIRRHIIIYASVIIPLVYSFIISWNLFKDVMHIFYILSV